MQSSSSEHLNELKTQLVAREGTYHLVPHAEYSRPKVSTYAPNNGIGVAAPNSTPVRVSFAKVHCTDVINSPNPSGGNLGNPFLPTIHYNRISHSNDGLNSINNTLATSTTNNVGVGPGTASIGTNTTNTSVSSASPAYLNHHSDNSNEHSHVHRNNLIRASRDFRSLDERIVFNIGREVFIFAFNGLQPSDLTKLVDRRNYKASFPTCHDIFSNVDNRTALLLIGFNTGQIQFVDLYRSEVNRFFNSERLIEKSKVTCVRWLPRSKSNFLVSYSSGQMYLFKEDLTCGTTAPNYQQFKAGEGFTIFTCKTKSSRNPIFRWSIGEGAIHEFAFSPCGEFLAIVSQDGFLRVFHYDKMELVGRMRSYFGGLLCIDWSPDSKFIVTGGEDDLITVWSHSEKRVVARGQGHKSWVNVVAFDPYMIDYNAHSAIDSDDFDDNSLEDGIIGGEQSQPFQRSFNSSSSSSRRPPHHHDSKTVLHKGKSVSNEFSVSSYRIGSVGQDTQICLWDLTDDIIRQSSQQAVKARDSLVAANTSSTNNLLKSGGGSAAGNSEDSQHASSADSKHHQSNGLLANNSANHHNPHQSQHHNHHNAAHHFFNSLIKSSKSDKADKAEKAEKSEKSGESHHKHHKSFSLSSRSFSDKHHKANNASSGSASGQMMLTNCTGSLGSNHAQNHSSSATICDPGRLLGTALCPRLDDVPMLEPHVCKKVAHERLTELIFCKDYITIANQDGKVSLFARPSKSSNMKMSNSPNASSLASDLNDIACDDNSAII